MNRKRFDALTRVLGEAPTRRALLPVLGSLLAAPLVGVMPGAAKKKRKKKKTTLCFNGQTIQASKKKKKKLLKKGATPGACLEPVCTPSCPGNACGGGDGCGGICGCSQGAFCDGGVCKSCDVTDAAGLQAALTAGGTVSVCPGRYIGNFSLTSPNLTLIGAGDGDDPATSTILDANGAGTVLEVEPPGKATLQRLRITGGAAAGGAGVVNLGELTLDDCTVTGNHSPGAAGGFNNFDTITLNGCTISGNSAGSDGGGIRNLLNSTVNVNNTDINGNTAGDQGGGVYNEGNLIFNQASKVRNNIANSGGGIFNDDIKGSVTLNDTSFSGNNPNNCIGC